MADSYAKLVSVLVTDSQGHERVSISEMKICFVIIQVVRYKHVILTRIVLALHFDLFRKHTIKLVMLETFVVAFP